MSGLKDSIRDYATEAFRFYARSGKPTYEELKAHIYEQALESEKREITHSGNISKPTEYAVINAQRALAERQGELLDVLAVDRVMKILSGAAQDLLSIYGNTVRFCIRRTIEIVYFTDADRPLQKGDITERVHKAELDISASEMSIYRWLAKARRMFAEERGLRFKNDFPAKLIVQRGCKGV